MTVESATASASYTGNGVTAIFPVPFYFLVDTDLKVTRKSAATGLVTTLVLNSDYTLTGAGNSAGGSLTSIPALPNLDEIYIERNVTAVQETAYPSNGPFPAASHERALDRLTMLVQQLLVGIGFKLGKNALGTSYDAGGNTVSNAADAVNATDLTTQQQVDQKIAAAAIGVLPADVALNSQLSSTASGKGAALVGFHDVTAPAYLKTVSDILNGVPVNVRRFFSDQSVFTSMLDGSTTYDATVALKAALTAYSENQSRRGGRLDLGRGRFIVNDTLHTSSYATDNAINLEIVGEGFLSTWLDFSAMTGTKDALVIDNDQQIALRGFYLKGGAGVRDGIVFGRNLADGGSNSSAVSIFELADVRVQACGRHGVRHYNSYQGRMSGVYAIANGGDGFRHDGYHTSLTLRNCYARANAAGAGFRFNGIVYSSLDGCASDANAFGYVVSNARALAFKGCGAEGNTQDGWYVFADNTGAPTEPLFVSECYDVRGVSLENCSGYGNNIGNAGYAGLLRVSATGVHSGAGTYNDGSAHVAQVTVRNCDANVSVAGTKAIVTQQSAGGLATVVEEGNCYFPGGRTIGTGTTYRNLSLRGKRCTVTLSADQNISASVLTDVSWGAATDELGAWSAGSPTILTVPTGVSKIRLTVETGWASDATGSRMMIVYKNGSTFSPGFPRDERAAAGTLNTTATCTSPVLSVAPGDTFKVQVQQTTAGAIALKAASASLTMEVVE